MAKLSDQNGFAFLLTALCDLCGQALFVVQNDLDNGSFCTIHQAKVCGDVVAQDDAHANRQWKGTESGLRDAVG